MLCPAMYGSIQWETLTPRRQTVPRRPMLTLALLLALPLGGHAQDAKIASAEKAAPASVSKDATILDWSGDVIREGSNGWACLPDREYTEGEDPWCVNGPWLNFLQAYMTKQKPSYDQVGIAYMLVGDAPVSNTDPYATEKTNDDDWVEDMGPHLMILVPDKDSFESISTDPNNGGPWVMWPETPYAHIMIPLEGPPK